MHFHTKELTKVAMNVLLIGIASKITIPLGWVPFTLQLFAICLIAIINTQKIAMTSIGLYVILGSLGLPLFAMGWLSPSYGFVVGFIPFTYLISKQHFILAEGTLYFIGLSYLAFYFKLILNMTLPFHMFIFQYMLIFIPTDLMAYLLARKLSNYFQ